MYYLSLPKDIYISDTPPSDGYTLFWIKDTTKNAFIARGPRIPEASSKLSANHFQTKIVGSDLLSIWQFDEAPEVMIYDTVVGDWTSYSATAGGDLVPSCLSWSVSNGSVEIVSCDYEYAGKVTVPAFIDGMPVTSIGMGCFQCCEQITEIILPDTIYKLLDSCFVGCTNLTKIVVPNTITSIGYDPVYGCDKLAFSTYGYFKYLGTEDRPYLYCFGIDPNAPENVDCVLHTDTRALATGCCQSYGYDFTINSIYVPGTPGLLQDECFLDCSVKTVVLAEGTTSIPNYAFCGCSNLENISLPSSLRTIGNSALAYTALQQFECPEGLVSLGDSVFYGCEALTRVVLSDSVLNIGYMFDEYGNTSLQEVIVGKNLQTGLETCGIRDCSSITSLVIPDENPSYSIDSHGVLYNKEKTLIYFSINKQLGDYQMPNTVEELASSAFSGCTFGNLITSENLKKISHYAFMRASISSIQLFPNLSIIEYQAFECCTSLTSIDLPDGVSVGRDAFHISSLRNVTVPSTVHLDSYVFGSSSLQTITFAHGCAEVPTGCCDNCTSLKTVNLPDTITTIHGSAFRRCLALTNITIPDSIVYIDPGAFKEAKGLLSCTACKEYAGGRYIGPSNNPYWLLLSLNTANTTLQLHKNTKVLGSYCCEKCINVTDVVIPNTVTVGDYVFSGCTGLVSATLEEGITAENIGSYLFSGCTKLTSVTLPNSLTAIANGMFYGCTGLTSLPLSNTINTLKYLAFSGCTGLAQITLPDSVTTLGNEVFKNCTGLMTATIPSSVTTLGTYTFYGCSSLYRVTLPDNSKEVPDYTFTGCKSLASFVLPNSVTKLGKSCFRNCSALSSVTLNVGLEFIDDCAFEKCSNLTSIKLPISITKLNTNRSYYSHFSYGIFYECSRLANIYVPFSPDSELAEHAPWGASKAAIHYNYVN